MSGKSKRILYYVISTVLLAAALVGGVLMWWFKGPQDIWAAVVAIAVYLILQPSVLLHELGHVIAGSVCGMKFVSFKTSYLLFDKSTGKLKVRFLKDSAAGSSAFYPKNAENLRGRVIATTLGGAICNLIVGAVLLALFLALPYHPVLFVFAFFGPLNLAEGLSALIPASLPSGKTDGAVLFGLIKKSPEEEIMLSVLEAQAVLSQEGFTKIKRTVLFDTPVVQEDLPAFRAVLLLRVQYLLAVSDDEGAKKAYDRLAALGEDTDEEEWKEIERYGAYFEGNFKARTCPLKGVNALEEELETRQKIRREAD